MDALTVYLALGIGAGLLAGLFGIGGGLVVVPALAFIFETQSLASGHRMQLAVGTSLATIVVTALASTVGHHRRGGVLWPVFGRLAPGLATGALAGVAAADLVSSPVLRVVFAVFLFVIAAQLVLELRPKASRHLPGKWGLSAAGAGIGMLSALVGIGGGTLTTPYLLRGNIDMRHAIGTSAACGLPIAAVGTLAYVGAGMNEIGLPADATGFVYWPAVGAIAATSMFAAPLGARLAHALPVGLLRRLFAALLMVVAWRLTIG